MTQSHRSISETLMIPKKPLDISDPYFGFSWRLIGWLIPYRSRWRNNTGPTLAT